MDVQTGGAAEAAGLIDGDTIIGYKNSSYDEFRDILNFNDLREAILNSQVGEEVQLKDGKILRGEKIEEGAETVFPAHGKPFSADSLLKALSS